MVANLVKKLQKERNFVGQTEEQRRILEKELKKRYDLSNWESKSGIGYLICDKKDNENLYFSHNAKLTLETRYLEKNENRKVCENPLDLFARVAVNIAEADLKYNSKVNITATAEQFLENMIYKKFMPNTPTLCNAGRSLQQLSACFVLPVADYMATEDIGEDPEHQGSGIYDTLRHMAMIHKSGGGTGFNFSHLRPRGNQISTTFGTSSGPISFIKSYDEATNAVNQGGFRRGANMGILNYTHPDIFEFISEKARKGTIKNFNLSVGVNEEFMKLVEEDGYFNLINPKNENTIPEEKRIWKSNDILTKGTQEYNQLYRELNPSIIIDEDKKTILNAYTNKKVGKVDNDKNILISTKKLFNEITQYAWEDGCPGIIFLDRLEANNKTPHIGKIESTNPCGEQPLLPYESCNLGAINLSTCVKEGTVNYVELEKRVQQGVHFLDNVIDMSKFPFQKIYGNVHGNRKIGLGLMGWAEMLTQLKISYDSDEAISLAKEISSYVTDMGLKASEELAEKRGVFPYWQGSFWEKNKKKVRNATITTIAPNGTTAMIGDCTGGIEPFFKLSFKKTCMDSKELIYRNPLLENYLSEKYSGKDLENKLREVDEEGSIKDIEDISKDIKDIFKTSHEISPENHVKMQAAFQFGVHNAVSKTVNLPNKATVEDVRDIYKLAYKKDCMGITIFRDGSKEGVYSGLERKIEIVQNKVKPLPILDIKSQAIKYKVERPQNNDSLHITISSDLCVDDKTNKAYFIPSEIFQSRTPLGHSISVSFAQSGIDRTDILKGADPDYSELIKRWQSAFSNEEEGFGPHKIKSIEHAVGVAFEDCLLRNGIIGYDEILNKLINIVRKPQLRKVKENSEEYKLLMSQIKKSQSDKELIVIGNNGKLGKKFVCEFCEGTEYTFEAGCNHPKCLNCGEIDGGGCG